MAQSVDIVSALLDDARAAEERDQVVDALDGYRQALQREPSNEDALLGVGRICLLLGDHPHAIEDFSAVLTRNPHCAEAFRGRAVAFLNVGLTEKAMGDLDNAVRLSDHSLEILTTRAFVDLEVGNLDRAGETLRQILEQEPDDPDVALALAHVLLLRSTEHPYIRDLLETARRALDGDRLLELLALELRLQEGAPLDELAELARRLLQEEPDLLETARALPRLRGLSERP